MDTDDPVMPSTLLRHGRVIDPSAAMNCIGLLVLPGLIDLRYVRYVNCNGIVAESGDLAPIGTWLTWVGAQKRASIMPVGGGQCYWLFDVPMDLGEVERLGDHRRVLAESGVASSSPVTPPTPWPPIWVRAVVGAIEDGWVIAHHRGVVPVPGHRRSRRDRRRPRPVGRDRPVPVSGPPTDLRPGAATFRGRPPSRLIREQQGGRRRTGHARGRAAPP
jgi:hypothetical protein